jgi:hypothetical protein
MSQLRAVLILVLSVLMNFVYSGQSFSNEETISIPCEVKECKPELGSISTKWYKGDGDKNKPVIMFYGGGVGTYVGVNNQPIVNLKSKFDIIMVASPIPQSAKNKEGYQYTAFADHVIYRQKVATEYYKKKLNRPIWLGGSSSGGPRVIGTVAGDEKTRPSDTYAGLIFASAYVAKVERNNGMETGIVHYNMPVSKIKYKMNLPILIIQHARDLKAAQHPRLQKMFQEQLAKKNSNKTELMLLTEGLPMTTNFDGGHHWFSTNKEEVARVVSKFILDNTK